MSALLLDASVWLAALDSDDPQHVPSRSILRAVEDQPRSLAALDLTLYEVANVAVVRWRSPEEAQRLAGLIAVTCQGMLERVDKELLQAAGALAAAHGLTVYDAAYLATARRRGWTLVSCDMIDLVRLGFAVAPDAVELEH